MKLSQLVVEYLIFKRALGHHFVSEGFVLRALCRSLGDPSLADMRSDHTLAFLRAGQVSQATIARKHRVLTGLSRYALGRYGLALPLPPTVQMREPSGFIPYIYSHEELRRLMQAATPTCSVRQALIEDYMLRTVVLLLYGAALRLGEALALNLADVDLRQAILTIRQTKFHKTRLVPLGDDLVRGLIAYRRQRDRRYVHQPDCPFFCLRNGKRVNPAVMERTFRRLRNSAGVARKGSARNQPRLHDLRHTAAVHRLIDWYRRDADLAYLLPKLAIYLGHKNLSSTQRYLTLTAELLHEASLRFERYALENSDE